MSKRKLRETFGFGGPVRQQRRRCHQQTRTDIGRPLFAFQHQQQRQHLNRFAEPHVVSQTRA